MAAHAAHMLVSGHARLEEQPAPERGLRGRDRLGRGQCRKAALRASPQAGLRRRRGCRRCGGLWLWFRLPASDGSEDRAEPERALNEAEVSSHAGRMGPAQYAGNGCAISPPNTTPLDIAAALAPDSSPSASAGSVTSTGGAGLCGAVTTTTTRSRGDSPGSVART